MIPTLPRALRGEVLDPSIWEGDLERDAITADSDNLLQLAAAHALLRAVNTSDYAEINFWCDWWMRRLAWERANFMGKEVAGRTYPSWHFMGKRAVLDVARRLGRMELAVELLEWMLAFLALAALASGRRPGRYITDHRIAEAGVIVGDGDEVTWSGRFCAWSGDRADSRMSERDAASNGVPTGTWCGWLSISSPTLWLNLAVGSATGDCDEAAVERACAYPMLPPEEAAILRGVLAGNYQAGLDRLRGHRPNVPIRIVQADDGVWTLSPVGRGSSTPHAYAVAQWHATGVVKGLYADPGWRHTGKDDWICSGTASENAGVAVAQRDDGRYGSPHTMVLPGGARSLDVTWGPDGVAVAHPEDGGAPTTPPPTDPTPPPAGDGAPEVVQIDRPGKWLIAWRGRIRLIHDDDQGRSRAICDQPGDPE